MGSGLLATIIGGVIVAIILFYLIDPGGILNPSVPDIKIGSYNVRESWLMEDNTPVMPSGNITLINEGKGAALNCKVIWNTGRSPNDNSLSTEFSVQPGKEYTLQIDSLPFWENNRYSTTICVECDNAKSECIQRDIWVYKREPPRKIRT
jgi:hypothetical protein